MSAGASIPWAKAFDLASRLVRELEDSCDRIEIAGSLRRLKPEVHDIELVAVPKFGTVDGGDLWGTSVDVDLLTERLEQVGGLRLRNVESQWRCLQGPRLHGNSH